MQDKCEFCDTELNMDNLSIDAVQRGFFSCWKCWDEYLWRLSK